MLKEPHETFSAKISSISTLLRIILQYVHLQWSLTSCIPVDSFLEDQLSYIDHIAKTKSCSFTLHNIRKIRPFLMEHVAQLLEKNFSWVKVTTLASLFVKMIPHAHQIMLWVDEPWHPRILNLESWYGHYYFFQHFCQLELKELMSNIQHTRNILISAKMIKS